MLPTLLGEQLEATLNKLEKKKSKILLKFGIRFHVTENTFGKTQISDSQKAKVLFIKLSRDMQKQLAILKFEECTIKKLIN